MKQKININEDKIRIYRSKFSCSFDRLIKDNEYTHQFIADKTGFSTASISNWRKGVKIPSIVEVWILADFFDVSVDVFIGRKDY